MIKNLFLAILVSIVLPWCSQERVLIDELTNKQTGKIIYKFSLQ